MEKLKTQFFVSAVNGKRKRVIIAAVALLIIGALVAGLIYSYNSNKQKDLNSRLLNEKIDNLDQESADCKKVIQAIGEESTEKYGQDGQKRLLERQFNCFSENGDNERAIKAAEKLKKIYQAENNESGVRMVEAGINNISLSKEVIENDERNNIREPVQ